MNVTTTGPTGMLILEPRVFSDERGFFTEVFHAPRYEELGLPAFVQDNLAGSKRNVLRGLHYQWPRPQAKLVWVVSGAVLDVAVDLRRDSATFGEHAAIELSAENGRQLFIPQGFAHGYLVLSEFALLCYKCSDVYVPENDRAIRWNDPRIGIDWPVAEPVLSDKDRHAPRLEDAVLPDLGGAAREH